MSKSESQAAVEATLEGDLRQPYTQLVDDYNQAARLHTRYTGAPSYNILAELIRRGWRKQSR